MKAISVKNVSMRFSMGDDKISSLKEYVIRKAKGEIRKKELWALEDVSFDVESGEVVGIIGHNGAGKSTILKVISGILTPTRGKVETKGVIVPMLELGSGFDYDLTGRENIFLNGAILGYDEDFLLSKYDDILAFSELGEFIDMPIRNYSSGMLMRLAFSIATVVDPEIMIVDEILAVGDADFQEKSKARMLEMMSGGTTVLFVSHSIAQIEEMCSRVVWLDHGRVKMIGDAGEVCDAYQGIETIREERTSIYYDDGTGFLEEKCLTSPVQLDGKAFYQTYAIWPPVTHVRLDPVILTPCVLRNLSFTGEGEPLGYEVLSTNGTRVKETWYFDGVDSQIEVRFERPVYDLHVRGSLKVLRVD
ncbi:MAG: ABC transporter ATP-binding protein [Lachnospiraceae bacterium]|nr:ABC transporter ATP-binding protein [Lachnospiraceae bacterium]